MSVLIHFTRKILQTGIKPDVRLKFNNNCSICVRLLSYSALHYDGTPDPGPIFIKNEVQNLLRTLTRVDLGKVFRKRKLGDKKLELPVYKFMTDEELQQTLQETRRKVDDIIQIPPVVSVRKPIDRVLTEDPALQGFDTSNYIFTDITYGVRESDRIILIRETNGTLKEADWDVRSRINQMYLPVAQRDVKIPKMFNDDYFEDLLKRQAYEFILDRACLQFEPSDALYQKVVSITYQHINEHNKFDDLRSTRHFGSFAFFLAWHKMIDNLLLELIESQHVDEAESLVQLYNQIHQTQSKSDSSLALIEEYIEKSSAKKGALQLALQAYKNAVKQQQEMEEGIKRAHGLS